MTNLVGYINNKFGKGSATLTQQFFERMSLPIPESKEFSPAMDGGCIVFVSPKALTVRVTPRNMLPKKPMPGVATPLVSSQNQSIRLDLNYGTDCPITHAEALKFRRDARKLGLFFWDSQTQNCGYLPQQDDNRRIPIIIDPCTIEELADKVGSVRYIINKSLVDAVLAGINTVGNIAGAQETIETNDNWIEMATAQDEEIYRNYRDILRRAWSNNDDEGIIEFWQEAEIGKQQGILVAGWDTNPRIQSQNYKKAASASTAYANRVIATPLSL